MTKADQRKRNYLPLGVRVSDHIFEAGFLRGALYLIQADPGLGKAIEALRYIIGRQNAGKTCLYVTMTKFRADLNETCDSHGWLLDGIEICDMGFRGIMTVTLDYIKETKMIGEHNEPN